MKLLISFVFVLNVQLATAGILNPDFKFDNKIKVSERVFSFENPRVLNGENAFELWGTGGIFEDGTLKSGSYPVHLGGVCIGLLGPRSRYVSHEINPNVDLYSYAAIIANIDNENVSLHHIARFIDHPFWEPIGLSQNFPIAKITCRSLK